MIMHANYFAHADELPISRSASVSAEEEQAFYDKHADLATSARTIMCLLGTLITLVSFAALAEDKVASRKPDELITAARVTKSEPIESQALGRTTITSPVTTLVDGPTGFVFVYTAEGWKFVRNLNKD
jgi:hypothetical protein